MEKRVVFRSAWLPYALLAPQIAITVIFFFWPAFQAAWFSFQLQDAFGLKTEFVGLRNFAELFNDPRYLDSFKVTAGASRLQDNPEFFVGFGGELEDKDLRTLVVLLGLGQ